LEGFCPEIDSQLSTVALRIARVNHSCQPNAAGIYDEMARVAILFAQKDIQPGEEISICYYSPCFWLVPEEMNPELSSLKQDMECTYGITCSTNCSCYDPVLRALHVEGRQLYETTNALARQHKIEEALAAGDNLLDIYRRLNVSWEYLGRTEYLLFQLAVQKSETLPRAKQYIRSAVELFRKICPYSERLTKKYEKLMGHPETHPNYLQLD